MQFSHERGKFGQRNECVLRIRKLGHLENLDNSEQNECVLRIRKLMELNLEIMQTLG